MQMDYLAVSTTSQNVTTPTASQPVPSTSSIGGAIGSQLQAPATPEVSVMKRTVLGFGSLRSDEKSEKLISCAASNDRIDDVKALIQAGANVDQAGTDGETPLKVAAGYGLSDIVKVLIKAGANVDKADKFGETPLKVAAGY